MGYLCNIMAKRAQEGLATIRKGLTDKDLDFIVRMGLTEAGKKSEIKDLKTVYDVAVNRALAKRRSLISIVRQPDQFSGINKPHTTNYRRVMALAKTDPSYQRGRGMLLARLYGRSPDWTGGATHYYNPRLASPSWGGKKFKPVRKGKWRSTHVFGKTRF